MRKPEKIPIEKYDYPLPDDRIAKYPLADRDASKVLVYRPGKIRQKQVFKDQDIHEQKPSSQEHELPEGKYSPQGPELSRQEPDTHIPELIEQKPFSQVPDLLEKSDRLYFNATRVVQARLIFRKSTGARIEIFCLEPHKPADYQMAFSSTGQVEFVCLIGNVKKWKEGKLIKSLGELHLIAELAGRHDDKFIVRFNWNDPGTSFGEILERSGSTPIPPYLDREAEAQDATTYQTVYAREDGSVAAPTAGLHFTERVLESLDRKGIKRHELILHVGAGTFIPVKEENAVDHQMHAELVTVSRPLLESLLSGDRKIAVGTTTTRSLESIYWLGVKAISSEEFSFDNLFLDQWDAYKMEQIGTPDKQPVNKREDPVPSEKADRASVAKMEDPVPLEKAVRTVRNETVDTIPMETAVRTLLEKMDEAGLETFSFHTRLMITPGYRFRVIGGLFTNFHQPKSTLLLLIAAVTGDDWRKIYDYALENGFRFLSYGDSSLLYI